MAHLWAFALVSVVIISLLSFLGLLAFSMQRKLLRKVLLYLVSFSAGGLFGDAFIHLLPEAVGESGFRLSLSLYVLLGIAFSFFIEKVIRWRHCHLSSTEEHVHPYALMNLVGDGVHNFIDGLIIGASYLASIPIGIATTVAIVLHEIPQEIGDLGVLLHGGFSRNKALFFNFLIALFAVLGAIIALLLGSVVEGLTGFLLPFAAGSFIYIAGSDLIPELHKEVKASKSFIQFLIFLLGVGVMLGLVYL